MKQRTYVEGGVCAPLGFMASGIAANINGKGNLKKDLAIIFSKEPAIAAGVFTLNAVKAAPLIVTQEALRSEQLQAIVINSRNANACTGDQGVRDAKRMRHLTAEALGLSEQLIAVGSTGVIGVPLPMDRIEQGILLAAEGLSHEGSPDAASAIMTTDTFPKEIALQIDVDGSTITIGGIAKGSGMVHPNMATILGFITTDAKISHEALVSALQRGNANSFNMISVDGDTSTNDMVLILANGLANHPTIELGTKAFETFALALEEVLIYLAKQIAKDGEGATKLLEVRVSGAKSEREAKLAARAVSSSMLVKAALFGCDANWGRILCALGYSGAQFALSAVDIYIGNVQVMNQGTPLKFDEEAALNELSQNTVVLRADLNSGDQKAIAWGCDLSYDYVKINGAYRT